MKAKINKTSQNVFNVGDTVRFKTWEQMAKEYGESKYGFLIGCHKMFTKPMSHLCGTYATIRAIYGKDITLSDFSAEGKTNWIYSTDMIEPLSTERNFPNNPLPTIVKHEINGNKISITLSNGKIGESKCNPEDAFDVVIGTNLATDRAYSNSKKANKQSIKKLLETEKYVRVITAQRSYPDYSIFLDDFFPQYKKFFKAKVLPTEGEIYKDIAVHFHHNQNKIVHLIQDINTQQVFLIENSAVEWADKPMETTFKPYLELNNKNVGYIGDETTLTAFGGARLYVGDVVDLYNTTFKVIYHSQPIIKFNLRPNGGILGLNNTPFINGISNDGTWQIIKTKSYRELQDNECMGTISVHLKENK